MARTKTQKIKDKIELLKNTINLLEGQIKNGIYLDWKEKEGKYFFVETFTKDAFMVYHIISVEENKLILRYGDIEEKYVSSMELDSYGEVGYKKWDEISKKEFLSKIKGFRDLDKEKQK